jgi:HEAT repeat protein
MGELVRVVLVFSGGLAATLVAVLVARRRWRSELAAWKGAAERSGLTEVRTWSTMSGMKRLTAKSGGLNVRIEPFGDKGTRVVIGGLGHKLPLNVRSEGADSRLDRAFGGREIEFGDRAFDEIAYVKGHPGLVRALFGPEQRKMLARILSGRSFAITEDELRIDSQNLAWSGVPRLLPDALGGLVEAARALSRPDDVASRIAANNELEPLAEVRRGNVESLAAEYPDHEATRRALVRALGDESAEVRLQAALALRSDGRPTLLDLAGDDKVPEAVAAKAIKTLDLGLATPLLLETLRHARQDGRRMVVKACIASLGPAGLASGFADLADMLAGEDVDLSLASALALGEFAVEGAEVALVAALRHPASEVRVAAARSLGRIGTPLAVAALRECRADHRFDADLRAVANMAIGEIQSRVNGASRGQLSLAAGEVGQVSLADADPRGRVSLARKETESKTSE